MIRSGIHGAMLVATILALGACGGPDGEMAAPRWNVLLVTLDTVRADRLGCYGNARIETPHIDRLASEGTLFENAFSPVPSTLPSHCSIMTGSYPLRHGVHDNGVYALEDEAVTLAERLAEHGFATSAFVAAFVLDPQFNLSQGFEVYDAEMDLPLVRREVELPEEVPEGRRRWVRQLTSAYQRRGDVVTDRALDWLGKREDRPFFLWVHYFDAHQPYQAPAPWTTHYDPDYEGPMDGDRETYNAEYTRALRSGWSGLPRSDWKHMVARYDGEVSFLDGQVGRLFDGLRTRGVWGDTLVIVVGDHGESFGEHGVQIWEHNSTVFDEVLRVPLIMRRPDGVGAGRRVAGLVRTIDVAPTVLDALDLPAWKAMQGTSLLDLTASDDAEAPGELLVEALRERQINWVPYSLLGLRTDRFKVVLRQAPDGTTLERSLFDLAHDSEERDPTAGGQTDERLATLVERLWRQVAALSRSEAEPERDLDELTSKALEALGYVDR